MYELHVYTCVFTSMAVYCVWQVSKWYVVLNGQLKLIREREGDRILQVGDSWVTINVHTCMYMKCIVYMYIPVRVCNTCVLIYINESDIIYMSVYTCTYVHVYTCIYMYIHVYICTSWDHACDKLYMYMYMLYLVSAMYIYTYIHTCTCIYMLMRLYMYTQ